MKIKEHIPNILTLLNLLSGCIAIVFAFENIILSSYLVGIAAIFDFLDGFAARLLNVKSKIGKDLDSLADMVSFGVVPGIILFRLIETSVINEDYYAYFLSFVPFIAFLIPLFSALRLAKFNTDTRQEEMFYGLPTPANAILIASLPLILNQHTYIFGVDFSFLISLISNLYFLISLTIILSYLLIAEIPLLSLKFKSFGWEKNKARYVLLFLSLILLILFQYAGIPLIILLYILMSLNLGKSSLDPDSDNYRD